MGSARTESGGHSSRPAVPGGARGLRLQGSSREGSPSLALSLFSFYFLLVSPLSPQLCLPPFFTGAAHTCSLLCFSVFTLTSHPLSWPFYFLLSVLFSMWRESCPQNLSSLSFGGNDQPQETNSSYLLETSRLIFPSKDWNTKGYWPHQWISRNVY